jgi:hypothetical protein
MNYDDPYTEGNPYMNSTRPYGSYYDPYGYAKYNEWMKSLYESQRQKELESWRGLALSANTARGLTGDELKRAVEGFMETVDPKPPETMRKDMTAEELRTLNVMRRLSQPQAQDLTSVYKMNDLAVIQERIRSKMPVDMSIDDFCKASGGLISDIMRKEQIEAKKDLSKMYDSKTYNMMLDRYLPPSGNIFTDYKNRIRRDIMASDMNDYEVRMPSHIQSEYSQRRESFLRAIKGHTDSVTEGDIRRRGGYVVNDGWPF